MQAADYQRAPFPYYTLDPGVASALRRFQQRATCRRNLQPIWSRKIYNSCMPQHSSKESGEDFEKCEDATVFAFVDSAREEFVIAE